jgi:ASC-1-like (ASCH) protein
MKLSIRLTKEECARLSLGQSVVKGVLANQVPAEIRVGETLEPSGCDFTVRIHGVRSYPNYRTLVLNEGIRRVAPDADIAGAIEMLQGTMKDEEVAQIGVVAITLEKSVQSHAE